MGSRKTFDGTIAKYRASRYLRLAVGRGSNRVARAGADVLLEVCALHSLRALRAALGVLLVVLAACEHCNAHILVPDVGPEAVAVRDVVHHLRTSGDCQCRSLTSGREVEGRLAHPTRLRTWAQIAYPPGALRLARLLRHQAQLSAIRHSRTVLRIDPVPLELECTVAAKGGNQGPTPA